MEGNYLITFNNINSQAKRNLSNRYARNKPLSFAGQKESKPFTKAQERSISLIFDPTIMDIPIVKNAAMAYCANAFGKKEVAKEQIKEAAKTTFKAARIGLSFARTLVGDVDIVEHIKEATRNRP